METQKEAVKLKSLCKLTRLVEAKSGPPFQHMYTFTNTPHQKFWANGVFCCQFSAFGGGKPAEHIPEISWDPQSVPQRKETPPRAKCCMTHG